MELEREEITRFTILLQNEKDKILTRKNQISQTISEETEHFRGQVLDNGDEAEVNSRMKVNLDLHESFSRMLKKIEVAMQKINEGTFGDCTECEQPISPNRLKFVPWEPQCIECKVIEEMSRGVGSSRLAQEIVLEERE